MRPLPEPVIDVPLTAISTDEPFQVRVDGPDDDHIEALTVACEMDPGSLPPVVLTRRPLPAWPKYFIVDGHHEVAAYERANRDRVRAIVLDLSDKEAIDLAWERNRENARNVTFKDRLAHARRLSERQPPLSDAEIARICGISRTTVWRHSNDVSQKQSAASPVIRYLRRVAVDHLDWETAKEAARELRRAIPNDEITDFVERLGNAAVAVLDVAEQLGYSA